MIISSSITLFSPSFLQGNPGTLTSTIPSSARCIHFIEACSDDYWSQYNTQFNSGSSSLKAKSSIPIEKTSRFMYSKSRWLLDWKSMFYFQWTGLCKRDSIRKSTRSTLSIIAVFFASNCTTAHVKIVNRWKMRTHNFVLLHYAYLGGLSYYRRPIAKCRRLRGLGLPLHSRPTYVVHTLDDDQINKLEMVSTKEDRRAHLMADERLQIVSKQRFGFVSKLKSNSFSKSIVVKS